MQTSRLTSKYQATVPEKIRKALCLEKGDLLGFELQRGKVLLKKVSKIDLQFAKSLESTLTEWNSKNDDEAYRDL